MCAYGDVDTYIYMYVTMCAYGDVDTYIYSTCMCSYVMLIHVNTCMCAYGDVDTCTSANIDC